MGVSTETKVAFTRNHNPQTCPSVLPVVAVTRISCSHFNAASAAAAKHVVADSLHVVAGQVAVVAAQAMQTERAAVSLYAFGVGCAVNR